MMQNIYGVINSNNVHIDISTSLKATKRFATINGYNIVSIRYNGSYNAEIIQVKHKNYWKTFNVDTYKEIIQNN